MASLRAHATIEGEMSDGAGLADLLPWSRPTTSR
jgi:hypothetical protein